MSMEIKIPTKEIETLIKKFAEAEGIYDEYARPSMENAINYILAKVIQKSPYNRGEFRGSIGSGIEGRSLSMRGFIASPSVYALALEHGLPAQKVFPPLDAIQRWVETKGITVVGATSRQVAYLIAQKIYRKGTEGKAMFKTSMDESERFVTGLFEQVNAKFVQRFAR